MAESLQKKLVLLGPERLASLLGEHARHDKALNKKIKLALVSLNPVKLAKTLRTQLDLLRKSQRYIDWQQIRPFTAELKLWVDALANDLFPQSPELTASLTEEFLAIGPSILERVDDSYGMITDIFISLVTLWGKAYARRQAEAEKLLPRLLSLTLKDNYGLYEGLIQAFIPALEAKGVAALEAQVMAKIAADNDYYERAQFTRLLQIVADSRQSPDEYINAFKRTGYPILDEAKLHIAKRLNNAWRSREAIQWLTKIEDKEQYFNGYIDLLIEAYDLEGDSQQTQAMRWKAFSKQLETSYYLAYLKAAPKEKRETIQQDALAIVLAHPDRLKALSWLLDRGYPEQAALLLRQQLTHIEGNSYYAIRPLAKQFAASGYPLEAVLLYRRLCEPILDAANSKNYYYAAKDLKQANELSQQVEQWQGFAAATDYMEALKKQHSRKYGFWQMLAELEKS